MVGGQLPQAFLLLLPVAVGAGLDLFLTVLVVLLSLSLGNSGTNPGLWWAVYGILGLLYLTEVLMERRPLPALLWHNLQLILRPLGGAMLAWILLEGVPSDLLVMGLLLTAVVAAFIHALSWGLKLQRFLLSEASVSPLTYSLGEDTFTLAFLIISIEYPNLGVFLVTTLLILGLLAGGPIHHLTRLGVVLAGDRVWGIMSPPRWQNFPHLPSWVRRWSRSVGLENLRGIPAGAMGLQGIRGPRMGWLLEAGGASFFAFRRLRTANVVPLADLDPAPREVLDIHARAGFAAPNGSETALFLQKTAPVPESHK